MVKYVVIGGGVAGVTAAEEIVRLAAPTDTVTLLSASRILKLVTNVQLVANSTEVFDLLPTDLDTYRNNQKNLQVFQEVVEDIDANSQTIATVSGRVYPYDRLCLALGARPKLIADHPNVIGIRDVESVKELCSRLTTAKRVMVVGNGGIALELLNEIRRIPLVWVIKHHYLGNTFLDEGASAFFMPHLFTQNQPTFQKLISGLNITSSGIDNIIIENQLTGDSSSLDKYSASETILDEGSKIQHPQKNKKSVSSSTIHLSQFHPLNQKRKSLCESHIDQEPGAALGPVWKTNLRFPLRPQNSFSDRDLVIETEATVDEFYTHLDYCRISKRQKHDEGGVSDNDGFVNGHMENPTTSDSESSNKSLATSSLTKVIFDPDLFGEGRLGLVAIENNGKTIDHNNLLDNKESNPTHLETSTPHHQIVNSTVSTPDDSYAWPLYVKLTNSKVYGVDCLISATGVIPNSSLASSMGLALSPKDSGILVDKQMRTSLPNVWAAGDVVTANWKESKHWFQMRLWSQARLMGLQAARNMVQNATPVIDSSNSFLNNVPPSHDTNIPVINQRLPPTAPLDVHFDLFTHVSRFFGFKVVLLGLFNGQGLQQGEYEIMVRSSHPGEYVKVVKDRENKVRGAMLIGDTELEELFENLILSESSVSFFDQVVLEPELEVDAPLFE